jgi:hypothetical protein
VTVSALYKFCVPDAFFSSRFRHKYHSENTSSGDSSKEREEFLKSRGLKRKLCDDDSESSRSSCDPETVLRLNSLHTKRREVGIVEASTWVSHAPRLMGGNEETEDTKPAAYSSAGQQSSISSDGVIAIPRDRLRGGVHTEGGNRDVVTDTSSSSGESTR